MKFFILAALVAAAAASTPLVHGNRGGYGPRGGYGHGGQGQDYSEPRPYHFQYAVDDPHYGPMMSQTEESNGNGQTQGYYSVNLPDGRTQHVKYNVDGYNGYNAEVSYEGYANHPQVPKGYAQPTYGGHAYRPVVAHPVVRAH